jgi:hypothetical protein
MFPIVLVQMIQAQAAEPSYTQACGFAETPDWFLVAGDNVEKTDKNSFVRKSIHKVEIGLFWP